MEHLRKDERKHIVSSLDPKENPIVDELVKKSYVVLSDVDYTLFSFDEGHANGQKELARIFGENFSSEVNHLFRLTLEGQRRPITEVWSHRMVYSSLIKKIQALQSAFIDTYGIKVFSREAEIAIAADLLGVSLNKELIEHGRDAYWDAVGNAEAIYPDAQVFVDTIHKKSIPLILMSGSDSIMKVKEDCSFDYDPDMSSAYKEKRFEKFKFPFATSVFGDPYDKPTIPFFEKVFQVIQDELGYQPAPEKILVVGDSERNDLEVPFKRGCTTLLTKRN